MATKACNIAKDLLKKNKNHLSRMKRGVDKKIDRHSQKLDDKTHISDKDKVKLEKILKERKEVKNLEDVLKSNDLINMIDKKTISREDDWDSIIIETINKQISLMNRSERVGDAIYSLSQRMMVSKDFQSIKTNIKESVLLKRQTEETGFKKSDLKESDIDLRNKKNKTMKANDKKIMDDDDFADIPDILKADIQEIIKGVSYDNFGKLWNLAGDSVGAKNMITMLLTNKFGSLRMGGTQGIGGSVVVLPPALDKILKKILNDISSPYDIIQTKLFDEELKNTGAFNFREQNRIIRETNREFLEFMYKRNNDHTLTPPKKFEEMINYIDKNYKELYELEKGRYGPFHQLEGYSVVSPSRKNMDFVKSKIGIKNLEKLIRNSMKSEITKDLTTPLTEGQLQQIDNIATQYMDKILEKPVTNSSKVKHQDLTTVFNEILDSVDLETAKLFAEKGFDKTKQSFQISRVKMNYSEYIMVDGQKWSIFDVMNDSHFDTIKGNLVERTKKVNTKDFNVRLNNGEFKSVSLFDDDNMNNFIDYLKREEDLSDDFITEFSYILNDLRRSQFIERDMMDGVGNQSLRIVRNFTTFRLLGSVIIPSMVEGALVIQNIGIGNFLKVSKEYRDLTKAIREGKATPEMKKELEDILFVASNERFQTRKNSLMADTETNYHTEPKGFMDKMENVSTSVADITVNKINQLSNFTAFSRGVMVMGYVRQLNNGKKLSVKRAGELNWTKTQADLFTNTMKKYDNDLSASEVLNKMKKDLDPEDYDLFEYGILQKGDNMVLNPNIGEGYYLLNNAPVGKTVLQFQNYITQAFNKMLMKGLSVPDIEFFAGMTTTIFMSAMIEMGKDTLKGKDAIKDYEEGNVGAIVQKALRNASHASNVPFYTDILLNMLGINTNMSSRHYDNSIKSGGDILNKLPATAIFNDFLKLKRELMKIADGDTDSYKVIQKLMKLIMPNLLQSQTVINAYFQGKYD